MKIIQVSVAAKVSVSVRKNHQVFVELRRLEGWFVAKLFCPQPASSNPQFKFIFNPTIRDK